MPLYYLYTRGAGSSTWTYSGWQLNVSGGTNSGLNVQARTISQTSPPNPGQWQTVSGVSENGNGNPNSPQNGDTLTLPSTVGGVTNIAGNGTYASVGDKGAGYYTSQGIEGDEGDWCAGSN
jgi:hypothetical protein